MTIKELGYIELFPKILKIEISLPLTLSGDRITPKINSLLINVTKHYGLGRNLITLSYCNDRVLLS